MQQAQESIVAVCKGKEATVTATLVLLVKEESILNASYG
jgi:hypothetical protein